MSLPRTLSRTLFPTLLCAPLLATAQTAPPTKPAPAPTTKITLTDEQTANIMKQLEQLEVQITKGRGDLLSTALAKFRPAAASSKEALALYLDCYRLVHFERRDLKQTDYQAWKDSNEERMKEEEFLNALQLQLEYLVLTIQAQQVTEVKEMGPLVTALQAYLPKVMTAVQDLYKHTASGAVEAKAPAGGAARGNGGGGGGGGRPRPAGGGGGGMSLTGILRQSVKSSDFSEAFQIADFMKKTDWTYSPLEITAIYETVIIPYYQEVKPEEVAAQWDARISAELAMQKITMSESEYGIYYKERLPELTWMKDRYLLDHDINAVMAVADMLKIVRENPNHPQAANWLKTIRQVVVDSQGMPQPSASSAVGAAGGSGVTTPPAAGATPGAEVK